jgi:serine O-acetyltransferase
MSFFGDDVATSSFAAELHKARQSSACSLPLAREAQRVLIQLLGILFPHFGEKGLATEQEIENALAMERIAVKALLHPLAGQLPKSPAELSSDFFAELPGLYKMLCLDAKAIYEGDPAASSVDEVIVAYPGFLAVAIHRIAHVLYRMRVPIIPRVLSEYAHRETGIDIHPGAQIGCSFCIDHGTGIVIGETTEIRDSVKIYQGVTLGALSVDKHLAKKKRHPTIEENVVIYSNATILGGDTVVGSNCIIGGNVWLTASVPPNSTVYHKSEVSVRNQK